MGGSRGGGALGRTNGAVPRLAGMSQPTSPVDPGRVAIGTWSGGRFMHFGEAVDDERFLDLVAPD